MSTLFFSSSSVVWVLKSSSGSEEDIRGVGRAMGGRKIRYPYGEGKGREGGVDDEEGRKDETRCDDERRDVLEGEGGGICACLEESS